MTTNTGGPSTPSSRPPSNDDHRYTTASDDEAQKLDETPASWLTLPHRKQLLILAICRLSEPLTQTSLMSYLYFLLESFHEPGTPPPSSATISRRAGIIASSFALSQCITGMLWGRLSDHIGRKPCILFGLLGTTISILGFGFSESFYTALAFRILGGCLNGNVGVLRTMMSETVREKKHQSRAFLIMPMCFNIGIIIGPALGGLLADPAQTWPSLFGQWEWCLRWRWALPNIVSAMFLGASWFAGLLFLEETLESKKHRRDIGHELLSSFARLFRREPREAGNGAETAPLLSKPPPKPVVRPPPLRKILTPNILTTLLAFGVLPLHNSTFMHLYTIYLSTPRSTPLHGGLSLSAHTVGLALSLLGTLGILCQILVYPPLQAHLGLLRSFQLSCCLFPLAYIAAPLISFLPGDSVAMWVGIIGVLGTQVLARTFALPGSVILLTNSVEEEGVMGTVNGIGSSLSSAARAVGPVVGAMCFAAGLDGGGVGIGGVFWGMAGVATGGALWGAKVREGKGLGA